MIFTGLPLGDVGMDSKTSKKNSGHKGRRSSENYPMLGSCKCNRNCASNLSEDDRIANHASYWNSKNTKGRNSFITTHVKKVEVKRRRLRKSKDTSSALVRDHSKIYELMKKVDGNTYQSVQVCRTFFLNTLGYKSKNGNVIQKALKKMNPITYEPVNSEVGLAKSRSVLERQQAIRKHVESFHPETSHYRYIHAPNRRYLPDTFSVTGLWEHFKKSQVKYANVKYEIYRKEFQKLNITICK